MCRLATRFIKVKILPHQVDDKSDAVSTAVAWCLVETAFLLKTSVVISN